MAHEVFISYSSRDKWIADAICATLESNGVACWIAPRDILPGADWSEAIIDALSAGLIFVLVLSAASNTSEQVKREVQIAVSEGLVILPVRIDEAPLSKHMRYFIGTPHWLDAMTPPLEKHLAQLAQTVHLMLPAARDAKHGDGTVDDADLLTPHEALVEARKRVNDAATHTPAPAPATPAAVPFTPQDPASLRALEGELAYYVGPMAKLLVKQAAGQAADLDELCDIVAERIPSTDERAAFHRRAQAALAQLARQQAPPEPGAVVEPEAGLAPGDVARAEKNLAAFIGPMAKILVKRATSRCSNLADLYRLLAEHIPTEQEKRLFLSDAPR